MPPPKARSKKSALSAAPSVQAKGVPLPQWPDFAPLAPTSDLALTSLLPNQIITISSFWTSALCKKYVAFLSDLPLVTTPGKPQRGHAVRVNDRFQIHDPAFARQLWAQTALKDLVDSGDLDGEQLPSNDRARIWGGKVLGLNPNIRIYRYSKGQFFDQHYDESNTLLFPSDDLSAPSIPAKTTWTLLLYLTSAATGCTGGETVFYPEPANKNSATPEPVVAVCRHGAAAQTWQGLYAA